MSWVRNEGESAPRAVRKSTRLAQPPPDAHRSLPENDEYAMAWEQEGADWRLATPAEVEHKNCRRPGCLRSPVAALKRLRRGRNPWSWWLYCEWHLYGRRIQGGVIEHQRCIPRAEISPPASPNPAASAPDLSAMVAIGERLRTQDNRVTSHPIFLVEQRERIYGVSSDYAVTYTWVDERGLEADEDTAASYEDNHRAGRSGIGMKEYVRVGYVDRWIFATACLTEQGAEAYIAANGHNLKSPRIYVASGYRNLEWQSVRAFLLSLAGGAT